MGGRRALRLPAFLQHVDAALAAQKPGEVAVLRLDVDGFAGASALAPTDVGSAALAVLSRRLLAVLGPGAALARLGGDDFAVAAAAPSRADLVRLCERLLQTAQRPIVVAGHPHPLRLSLSLGVHVARPGEQAADALGAATQALRTARVPAPREGERPSYRGSGSI